MLCKVIRKTTYNNTDRKITINVGTELNIPLQKGILRSYSDIEYKFSKLRFRTADVVPVFSNVAEKVKRRLELAEVLKNVPLVIIIEYPESSERVNNCWLVKIDDEKYFSYEEFKFVLDFVKEETGIPYIHMKKVSDNYVVERTNVALRKIKFTTREFYEEFGI